MSWQSLKNYKIIRLIFKVNYKEFFKLEDSDNNLTKTIKREWLQLCNNVSLIQRVNSDNLEKYKNILISRMDDEYSYNSKNKTDILLQNIESDVENVFCEYDKPRQLNCFVNTMIKKEIDDLKSIETDISSLIDINGELSNFNNLRNECYLRVSIFENGYNEQDVGKVVNECNEFVNQSGSFGICGRYGKSFTDMFVEFSNFMQDCWELPLMYAKQNDQTETTLWLMNHGAIAIEDNTSDTDSQDISGTDDVDDAVELPWEKD